MIEILHQYWQALLWSDGYRFTAWRSLSGY